LARRRVAVEFVAEMAAFRRGTRDGADDVRRLKDESKAAQVEVAKLGTESQRAAAQVGQSMREAAGQARNARGQFARAGSEAGAAFGDGLTRDALGRLRTADGRFAAEGRRLGGSVNRGLTSSLRSFGGVVSGSRSLLLLAAGATTATAALQGIPPVLAAIGGGLGSIPGLAAGASAALATLGVGLSGVGGAIGEIFDPPAGGGGGGGSGIDQTAGALRRLEQAERQLRYAQRDARESQIALNRAREQATRDLRDMALQLRGTRLDEKSAALAVLEAERDLREIRARGGDPLEIERAQLAYEQAQLTLEETRNRLNDLTIDQGRAAKAGVEGSDTVQQALRDQERAWDAVKDAQYGVLDAQEALAAAQAGGGGGGAAKQATEYDKLSKNAKKFVDAIRAQKQELLGLRALAQDRIFAGLDREFTSTFTKSLPFVRRQITRFGDDWNTTFKNLIRLGRDDDFLAGLEDALASSDRFFDGVNRRIPATGRMLAQLFTGSTVFIDRFGDTLLSYLDDFNTFIDKASRDGSLEEFFEDAADQAEALLDIGREVIELVGRIGGMDQGSTLLRDMADAIEQFNDEAFDMRSVEGIIATGNEAVKGLVEVLLVLGETLGETLADDDTREAVRIFFDVLGLGAEIVGGLAKLFGSLPGPIQSTVLAGAALALLGSRLFGIFGRLEGVLGRANGRLGQMGQVGAQAAVGLERAGRGARAAAAALLAVQVGSAAFGGDLNAQIDSLADRLDEFALGAEAGGEAARLFGDDMSKLDTAIKDVADTGAWSSIARGVAGTVESVTGLGSVFDDSLQKSKERLGALDAALASMVQSGNVAGAEAAFNRIAASAAEQGVSTRELQAVLPTYTAAVEKAGGANAIAAGQIDAFAEAQRTAKDATNEWLEAELGLEESMARATETITSNGEAWGVNSEKGRENRRALMDAAAAANEAVTAKLRETGSVEAANVVYRRNWQRLYDLAIQSGATKEQARQLANQLLKTPDVNVAFETPGLAQAVRLAREYNAMLDRIRRNAQAGGFGVNGNFLGVGGNRWGGVWEHAQVGLLREAHIAGPHPVARYAYAERGTGGEAFIPKYGNPDRSVSIGRRAMEWYGHAVVPKTALAGYGQAMTLPPTIIPAPSAAAGPVVLELRSSGARVDEMLLEILRGAVRVRGGDVQIVIGGPA
jgi:hypothetical protein